MYVNPMVLSKSSMLLMKLNSCLLFRIVMLKRKVDYITNINILFKYYVNGATCINLSDSIIGKDICQFLQSNI